MAEKRIETVEMRAGDVKTGFGNPRKITKKKKDELRNSIETFGDFGSFIIDEIQILVDIKTCDAGYGSDKEFRVHREFRQQSI